MVIEQQGSSPLLLTLKSEGEYRGSMVSVTVTMANVSDRAIRGLEIEAIDEYKYRQNVRSRRGMRNDNTLLAPERSMTLEINAGSIGNVGQLKRRLIRVYKVEFSDGETWPEDVRLLEERRTQPTPE